MEALERCIDYVGTSSVMYAAEVARARAELTALLSEADAARAALERYGRHDGAHGDENYEGPSCASF